MSTLGFALTSASIHAAMNKKQRTVRREAVIVSRGRRGADRGGGEVRPGHGDGVVDVQVAEQGCRTRAPGGSRRSRVTARFSCNAAI